MGGYLGNTINVEQMDGFARSGKATQVADWVIVLNLTPQAHVLYMRMGRLASLEDDKGVRVTLTKQQADELAGGDGEAALKELLKVGAVSKVAAYKTGKVRFEIEIYPPEVRALMGDYRRAHGLPVVTFG
ncbi:hypothetical protein [Streptomyces cucumeris]|uniref:hypothetical protein n=1 Tax=Streptomyces cucumeris TaxID=2962890 RepID=UPI0020C84063|nr:hypothetical protein [Streptomyces sp. NEAU-Y11]MCP9209646.1 hypothetical protein [Streptomyces sp. NEAU-Y11]